MIYLYAFIFSGVVCAVGQIILENSKLTPGDLNTILVVGGVILSSVGLYDKFISFAGAGATVPITNFGHLIFQGAYQGLQNNGFTGLLDGIFSMSSGGLCVTIIMAFLIAIIFKPKH